MSIPDLFSKGEPVFSFEFFPPKKPEDLPRLRETASALKPLSPGFVTMTYGAGGSSRERSIEAAGLIRGELGFRTASHLTCLGHTRKELESVLGRIRSLGIDSVVALRGDAPKDGSLEETEFRHAVDLVRLARSRGDLAIAVAGYPETHLEARSPEDDIRRLKEKVDAGAHWVITQLFFDNEAYFDFVERARGAGITVPIVPGIMPITSFKQTRKFTSMCGVNLPRSLMGGLTPIAGDKEAVASYGVEFAVRQCDELLERGAPGIHFYTLNRSRATAKILSRLRER